MSNVERLIDAFGDDAERGAAYFGQAAAASILFGESDEAGARARLAATYAEHLLDGRSQSDASDQPTEAKK